MIEKWELSRYFRSWVFDFTCFHCKHFVLLMVFCVCKNILGEFLELIWYRCFMLHLRSLRYPLVYWSVFPHIQQQPKQEQQSTKTTTTTKPQLFTKNTITIKEKGLNWALKKRWDKYNINRIYHHSLLHPSSRIEP